MSAKYYIPSERPDRQQGWSGEEDAALIMLGQSPNKLLAEQIARRLRAQGFPLRTSNAIRVRLRHHGIRLRQTGG